MRAIRTTAVAVAVAVAIGSAFGCDAPDDGVDVEREELDVDALDHALDHGERLEGSAALTTHDAIEAYPGFAVDIEVDGDDVVLDWTGVGGPLAVSIVSTPGSRSATSRSRSAAPPRSGSPRTCPPTCR